MSDLKEENLNHVFFSFPCSEEDKSPCYGVPKVIASPDVHKLTWFSSTTLSAEGGCPPVMGERLRAAPAAAAKMLVAACVPAGFVLFEY